MAKRRGRDSWVIEFRSIDPSRNQIVVYRNRAEAVEVATDFIRDASNYWLDALEWEPDDAAPDMLKDILQALDEGRPDDAIVGWLEYQNEYDPDERISIGPSGSVSDQPHDFAVLRR